jgi:hypothetical protein
MDTLGIPRGVTGSILSNDFMVLDKYPEIKYKEKYKKTNGLRRTR